jgi:hypothetical protein
VQDERDGGDQTEQARGAVAGVPGGRFHLDRHRIDTLHQPATDGDRGSLYTVLGAANSPNVSGIPEKIAPTQRRCQSRAAAMAARSPIVATRALASAASRSGTRVGEPPAT